MRLAGTFVCIWLLCGVIGAVVISALDSSNQTLYSELEHHGATATAVITATDIQDQGAVFYSFDALAERTLPVTPQRHPTPVQTS
jgi:hypothetical protein